MGRVRPETNFSLSSSFIARLLVGAKFDLLNLGARQDGAFKRVAKSLPLMLLSVTAVSWAPSKAAPPPPLVFEKSLQSLLPSLRDKRPRLGSRTETAARSAAPLRAIRPFSLLWWCEKLRGEELTS